MLIANGHRDVAVYVACVPMLYRGPLCQSVSVAKRYGGSIALKSRCQRTENHLVLNVNVILGEEYRARRIGVKPISTPLRPQALAGS